MKNKKFKAIISDIDGTLTQVKSHRVSDKVRASLEKLSEKNIPFSLATGRPYQLVESFVEDLGLKFPIITDNGAAIFDPQTGKSTFNEVMGNKQANKILKIVNSYNTHYHVSTLGKNYAKLEKISLNTKVRKFVIHKLDPKIALELEEKINNDFKDIQAVRTSANEGVEFTDVYITSIKASKQHAILNLSRQINVKPEEIIGIGDHYNDFSLLMACGLKVAMGNAVDDLKEIADYVAPSVDEDGVADVIEKYLL